MDAHHHPPDIQVRGSHLIQKVYRLRHKFKFKFRDDSNFHPYSEHRQCVKEGTVDAVTGRRDRDDDETIGRSIDKPYMSQPLLKLEEELVSEVIVRTGASVHGVRPEAGEAGPRAFPSYHLYDAQPAAASRQLKNTKPSVIPALLPVSAINHDRRGIKKIDQDANLNIEGLDNNNMHAAAKTATDNQGLDDDDVPLVVLKQHGSKHHGRSTTAIDIVDLKKPLPPDAGSIRNKGMNASSRAKVPMRYPISSSHDHVVMPQPRKAAEKTQLLPSPPAPISATKNVPSIGIMTGDSLSSSPSPVHLPISAGASSSSRPQIRLIPVTSLTIPSRLSRRISVDKDGNLSTLRFSPSIVTRHPTLPLNLPPLPPLTPARESSGIPDANSRKRDSRIGLRSMPALPRTGSGHGAGGHEEEDGDEDDMEDIEEEAEQSGHGYSNTSCTDENLLSSPSSEPSARSFSETNFGSKLPQVDISRLDLSFLDESPTPIPQNKGKGKAREDVDDTATPTDRLQIDYFSKINEAAGASSKALMSNMNKGASTPQVKRMSSIQKRSSGIVHSSQPGFVTLTTLPLPPSVDPERSGMYKRVSHSMIDIHHLKAIEEVLPGRDDVMHVEVSPPTKTTVGEELPPSPQILRRRRSLPSYYGPSAPPPPYPSFPHRIQPREDEGKEKLPPYSNDIFLKSILPRKMEFSQPGYQAKDRKWRRVICVLEGTMLRVYHCSPRVAGVSAIEGWWEKKTGVGDASSSTTSYVTATSIIRGPPLRARDEIRSISPPRNANKNEEQAMRLNEAGTIGPSASLLNVPLMEPKRSKILPFLRGRNHGRSNSDAMPQAMGNARQTTPRGSLSLPSSGSAVSSRTPSPGLTSRSSINEVVSIRSSSRVGTPDREEVSEPTGSELIKTYTLQNAECGLGLDYTKRRNVIRVKMEGEQFLLQAKDAPEVVAWIEGIQSGTNIALDLDERPMPRGPLIPRRRRRRGG